MRVVCAWCQTLLEAGSGPTSHGICPPCRQTVALGSCTPVDSPGLTKSPVEDGGAGVQVPSAAVGSTPTPPGAAVLACRQARRAWEQSSPQLFMEVWPA